MAFRRIHLSEVDSTNLWLQRQEDTGEDVCVVARSQTDGRGQASNHWESEAGKNLTFSLLTHPVQVRASSQYVLSMAIAVAVRDALSSLSSNNSDFTIKWPNDIYWKNGKMGGILIACSLQGQRIRRCVTGVGLNICQQRFLSDAPNPVSFCQTGLGMEKAEELLSSGRLLDDILRRYEHCLAAPEETRKAYLRNLYRREGLFPYKDIHGLFMAETVDVEESGTLLLRDSDGLLRRYAFKEVQFVMAGS
jgi:BirA family biotin operon repressor/biotin-[acetyl-CoA-carboxylase] ligase